MAGYVSSSPSSPNYSNPTTLFNTEQAAAYLGMSRRTLEAWRLRGGGPVFCKLNQAVRYRIEDLSSWVEGNLRESTSSDGEN